jgi:hypothetical protein
MTHIEVLEKLMGEVIALRDKTTTLGLLTNVERRHFNEIITSYAARIRRAKAAQENEGAM